MPSIWLSVEPDDIEDLLDLQQWINEDDELPGRVSRVPSGEPGRMGAAELLLLALTSASAVELIRCLREWIRSRRRKVVVSIKNEAGEVHISVEGTDDDSALIRTVIRMIDDE